uniref:Uncharacterized protein n=1 Tax=Anopheles atroparvus TaxID=41427 RepID=A0A182JMT1_ANOAO
MPSSDGSVEVVRKSGASVTPSVVTLARLASVVVVVIVVVVERLPAGSSGNLTGIPVVLAPSAPAGPRSDVTEGVEVVAEVPADDDSVDGDDPPAGAVTLVPLMIIAAVGDKVEVCDPPDCSVVEVEDAVAPVGDGGGTTVDEGRPGEDPVMYQRGASATSSSMTKTTRRRRLSWTFLRHSSLDADADDGSDTVADAALLVVSVGAAEDVKFKEGGCVEDEGSDGDDGTVVDSAGEAKSVVPDGCSLIIAMLPGMMGGDLVPVASVVVVVFLVVVVAVVVVDVVVVEGTPLLISVVVDWWTTECRLVVDSCILTVAGTVATWDVGLGLGRGALVVSGLIVVLVVVVVVVVIGVGRLRLGLVSATKAGDVVGRREYVTDGVVDSGFEEVCVVVGRREAMVVCEAAAIVLGGLRDPMVPPDGRLAQVALGGMIEMVPNKGAKKHRPWRVARVFCTTLMGDVPPESERDKMQNDGASRTLTHHE